MVSELKKDAPPKATGTTPDVADKGEKGKAGEGHTEAIHTEAHGADALSHARTFRLSAEKTASPLPQVEVVNNDLKRDGTAQRYQVQKGDTLSDIARRQLPPDATVREIYNQVREIAKANGITNPDKIATGQQLELPAKPISVKPPEQTATATTTAGPAAGGDSSAAGTTAAGAATAGADASGTATQPRAGAGSDGAGTSTTPATGAGDGAITGHTSAVTDTTNAGDAAARRSDAAAAVTTLTPEQRTAANLTTVEALERALGPDVPDVAPSYGEGGGMPVGPITDTRKVMQLLSDKSPEEIKAISALFAEKHGAEHGGRTLETILADRLSGTDKSKAIDLFHRSDKADDAGRVHTALQEMGEWGGRSVANCEKDLRDTLATMNSAQIAALKEDYAKRYGHSMDEDIAGNPKISADTKAALSIYGKGSENRSAADSIALANIATRAKNLDMFQEAFRDASSEARTQYMAEGGAEKMKAAFGGWFSDSDLRKAQDYVNAGKLDVVTKIRDNTGIFTSNDKAIDTAIGAMTQADRDTYARGKQVASTFEEYKFPPGSEVPVFNTEDYNKLPPEQKQDYDRYKAIHEAMTSAGSSVKVARWEDMLANKGETLATTLAKHGGLWSDKVDKALTDIENMSKADFDHLKADPKFRQEVEASLAMNYSGEDLQRCKDLLQAKLSKESFEAGGKTVGTRDLLTQVKDRDGFWNTDEKGIIGAVQNMTPEDQKRYHDDPKYKADVDRAIVGALGGTAEAYAALRILDHVSKGEGAKQDLITKMSLRVQGDKDTPAMLAEVEAALKEDPTLRQRLLDPVTPEDKALKQQFVTLGVNNFGGDFAKYVEPLIKNGSLPFEQRAKIYDGFWSDDTKGLYDAISAATPAERAAIAADPHKVLPFLNAQQTELAGNIARQNGEMRPEDKMRAAILGMSGDKDAIRELGQSLKPEERAKLVHDYELKYKSSLMSDLGDKLSGADRTEAERNFRDLPTSAREAYNNARSEDYVSNDGIGRSFVRHWDGTSDMARDDLNQYAAAMEDYSKVYREMPVEQSTKMAADLTEAVDLYRKSKGAAADAVVDGTIIVAGVGGAAFTGGVSLGLIATTGLAGAAFKVGARATIMGSDYDTKDIAADAATGAIDAATMVVGPGEIAKIFKIGGRAAATATDLALVEAGGLARASGRAILKEGAETTLKRELSNEVSTALAHGAKEINEKSLQRIAEKYAASPEDVAAVKALLTRNLNEAIVKESGSAMRSTVREIALNSGAGAGAGGGSGLVRGAAEWDNSKSVNENLQILAEKTAMGAGMGAAMGGGATVAFKAVGRGFAIARMASAENMRINTEATDIMTGVMTTPNHIRLDANGRVAEIRGIQTTKVEYHSSGLFEGQPQKVSLEFGTTFENVGENKWRMTSHDHPNGVDIDGGVSVKSNGEVHLTRSSGEVEVYYPNGLRSVHETSGNVRTMTDTGEIVAVRSRNGQLAEYANSADGAFEGVQYQNGRTLLRDEASGNWMLRESTDATPVKFDGTVTVEPSGAVRLEGVDGNVRVLNTDGSSFRLDKNTGTPAEIVYPDGKTRRFEYDADGKINRYTDADGTYYQLEDPEANYYGHFDHEDGRIGGTSLRLTVEKDGSIVRDIGGGNEVFYTDGRQVVVDTRLNRLMAETVPEGYAREGMTLDATGRHVGSIEARERNRYIRENFSELSQGTRGESIRQVGQELRDVKAIGPDGKPTSAYDSLMSEPNLTDAQKQNVLANMAIVREHYASYRSGDYMHGDPEVNWIHTQGEMAKALELGRANNLSPMEMEDSLLASMYSDSIKFGFPPPKGASANFFTHHLDGALAAKTALEKQGFAAERIDRIVSSIKAHQISPPNLMGELYYKVISGKMEAAIASGKISAEEGAHLRTVLKDMTQVGADGKARIRAISEVRTQPRELTDDGHMQLIFSEDQKKVLAFSGNDSWTVPYETRLDPNFNQYSVAEREAALSRQRVHQGVLDADGLDNYATSGGASKFVAIRGPETGFHDGKVWDSLESTNASYLDAYSLMSPNARKIADRNWGMRAADTDPLNSPLKTKMDDWLRSQGRDPSQPIPYYNSDLKYPTADVIPPGEKNLPGLNDAEMRDYLFAKEIREQMIDLLRREARVDASLPGKFEALNGKWDVAKEFADRSSPPLTLPGKRPADIAEGQTFASADGKLIAVRTEDGKLHVTDAGDNTFRKFDRQNNILQAESPTSTRTFQYDENGKPTIITTTDKSTGTTVELRRRDSSSDWVQRTTTADGKQTVEKPSSDLLVEPDGTVKRYFRDSRKVENIERFNPDGSVDIIKPTGRIEYVQANYAQERAKFADTIFAQLDDNPARIGRVNELIKTFEAQADSAARGLTENDKALLYKQLSRLLADNPNAAIPMAERINLAEQALDHSAHPWSVDQGANGTCNVTTIEHRNYWRNPDKNVQALADIAETGSYQFADGRTVKLRDVQGEIRPDYEARRGLARQAEGADLGLNSIKYDGERDYSSQLLETAMANYAWAERSRIVSADGRELLQTDVVMQYNKDGKALGIVDHNHVTGLYDKDGNAVRNYVAGTQYFDVHNRAIPSVPESRLLYSKDGRVTGYVDKMENLTMAYDRTGKPIDDYSFDLRGDEMYDADGKVLARMTAKGDLHYEKTPTSQGKDERIMVEMNGRYVELRGNDGKAIDHPELSAVDLEAISRGVNNNEPRDFILDLNRYVTLGKERIKIDSEENLVRVIHAMDAANDLPAVMVVNTSKPPFNHKPTYDSDGHFAGWHVINVHSVERVRNPVTGEMEDIIRFTNQWGSKADHLENGLPAKVMFEAMQRTERQAIKPKPLDVVPDNVPEPERPGRLKRLWQSIKPWFSRNKTGGSDS